MTTLRRRGLQIDDPLGPGRGVQPADSLEEPAVAEDSDSAPSERAQDVGATEERSSAGSARKAGRSDPAPRASRRSGAGRRKHSGGEHPGTSSVDGVWRQWSGLTGVGSFRLPHELLAELGDRARELGLPIGMIVAAALAQLLDQSGEEIAALVDRADDARIQGRRAARRCLGGGAGGDG
jgi:hypothetical protein